MGIYIGTVFMVVMGAFLAFDIGGFASDAWEKRTRATPWGRKIKESGRRPPNPSRLVGWIFLIAGTFMATLILASTLVHLFR